MMGTPNRSSCPTRSNSSSDSPLLESRIATSLLLTRPRSPWSESTGCRNVAGVPVDVNVAAILRAINPDFPQIESYVALITANERFAFSYPEKRPFFLEGVDLFATPFQAVYTRSVTAPAGGLRVTSRAGQSSCTALAVRDDGVGLHQSRHASR